MTAAPDSTSEESVASEAPEQSEQLPAKARPASSSSTRQTGTTTRTRTRTRTTKAAGGAAGSAAQPATDRSEAVDSSDPVESPSSSDETASAPRKAPSTKTSSASGGRSTPAAASKKPTPAPPKTTARGPRPPRSSSTASRTRSTTRPSEARLIETATPKPAAQDAPPTEEATALLPESHEPAVAPDLVHDERAVGDEQALAAPEAEPPVPAESQTQSESEPTPEADTVDEPVVVPEPEPEPELEAPAEQDIEAVPETHVVPIAEPEPEPEAPAEQNVEAVPETHVAPIAAAEPVDASSSRPARERRDPQVVRDAVLTISGLSKNFGDKVAVDAIDLAVPTGSLYGIVGPNGAGKTTTLSMVTGLLRPDSGRVVVHDIDVWAEPQRAKRSIGVLPDSLRLFDRLTGSQLLYYAGVLRGLDRETVVQRSGDLATAFGIEDAMGRLVTDYSAGMTKKIALAAAMIHSPRMLVLDEPFESVDPVSAANLVEILQRYVAGGGTVVLSSHGMDFIQRVCDHVAVIVGGRVLASGTMDEVREGRTLEERFVELAGGRKAAEGMEWLHSFSD